MTAKDNLIFCAIELLDNFYYDEMQIEKTTGTIKCRHKRHSMPAERLGMDKYLLDIIDKLSRKYGFIYQYTSNIGFIYFELINVDGVKPKVKKS